MHNTLRWHGHIKIFAHTPTNNSIFEHIIGKGTVNIYYECLEIVIILITTIKIYYCSFKPKKYRDGNA